MSAHKLYGPKGSGALYVRAGTAIAARLTGGGQEHGLRAGTENVPAIVGFGAAALLAAENAAPDAARTALLRDRLQDHLTAAIPGARVNGDPGGRLPGNLSLTLPGVEAADLLGRLPGIAASTGSACDTGSGEPSHVLTAIGLSRDQARATVRLGLGRATSREDVDRAAALIAAAFRDLFPLPGRPAEPAPSSGRASG